MKVLEIKVPKKTLHVTNQKLNGGRKHAIVPGQYVRFEQIGRIVQVTSKHGSPDLGVKVEIVERTYNTTAIEVPKETKFECAKCGKQFNDKYEAYDHFDEAHKAKPRAKRKGEKAKK
jgi:hypothetical protein